MKGMEKMMFYKHNGINFPVPNGTEKRMERFLNDAESLRFVDHDVITVGYPRSGNNWTFEVVSMIQRQETKYSPVPFYKTLLEYVDHEEEEDEHNQKQDSTQMNEAKNEDESASSKNWTMHARMSYIPPEALRKRVKVIYVIRNPKDVLVSLCKLQQGFSQDELKFTGSWGDFFACQMSGDFIWGSWIDHVVDFENFRQANPDYPVFLHSFERMKTDAVQAIREMCAFLGKPDAMAADIARAVSFEAMKKGTQAKMNEYSKNFMEKDSPGLIVKGSIGGWKNIFTVAQNETFNRVFREKLSGTEVASKIVDYL